jgi:hypothetical protein
MRLVALLCLLAGSVSFVTPAAAQAGAVFPLQVSANHRYLVDQSGAPFLMVGDSPQAMIGDISEADAEMFLANRQAAGFNTEWINLLCNAYTACRDDGSTYNDIPPFTTPGDLSTPNEAYFSKVDHVLRLAAKYGQLVLLDPIETGGWQNVVTSNGTSKATNYGKYLGQRYKSFPNIIWMSGNDFQGWHDPSTDAAIRAVAEGIHAADPAHLQTTELNYQSSGSLDDTSWTPLLGIDAAYTYFPTYDQVLKEYNRASMPVFMVEANYEGEHNAADQGTPQILRRQEYWTLLSGATGQLYGNGATWKFASNWKQSLSSPASNQMRYVTGLFAPRQWFNLVPDQNHTLLTGGYGTYSAGGSLGGNDYATAARTADGTLGIIYMPTSRTITVDLSTLAGAVNASWYDPSRGTYLGVGGSPLPNSGQVNIAPPGPNADGDADWVLVLETAQPPAATSVVGGVTPAAAVPPTVPPPAAAPPASAPTAAPAPAPASATSSAGNFVQTANAVPQSPQHSVSVTYSQSQTAGNTNILAIGWNDSSSDIASVSDSAGNTYHVAAQTARGDGVSQAIYYAASITGGNNTVTVSFNASVPFPDIRIAEYAGLDKSAPFDASASASGTQADASSGAATASGLVFGAGITTGAFTGAGGDFTARVITSPDADIVEDRTVSASGAYAATAPVNGNWVMQVATFH